MEAHIKNKSYNMNIFYFLKYVLLDWHNWPFLLFSIPLFIGEFEGLPRLIYLPAVVLVAVFTAWKHYEAARSERLKNQILEEELKQKKIGTSNMDKQHG